MKQPNGERTYQEKQERMNIVFLIICLITVVLLILAIPLIVSVCEIDTTPEESFSTIESGEIKETSEAVLSAYGPSENYYYIISEEDKIMMAKVVWAESRGEPYEGKVAVAAVILNRYSFDENEYDFKNDSIKSVILQKNQFASIKNVTSKDLDEYPECMQAVEAACKGWDPTRKKFKEGALYFYAPDLISEEMEAAREGIEILVIGGHNFHIELNE